MKNLSASQPLNQYPISPGASSVIYPKVFNRILKISVSLPIALTLILTVIFIGLIIYLMSVVRSVGHVDKVIAQSHETINAVLESQNRYRGFLLTGNEDFFGPFNGSALSVEQEIGKLKEMAKNYPEQLRRMDRISSIHQEWKAWSQKNIELKRQGNNDYLKRVSSGLGKRQIDEIRRQFSEFIHFEERLHAERSSSTEEIVRYMILLIISLSVLFGIFLALYSRRQLKSLSGAFSSSLQKQTELNQALSNAVRVRDEFMSLASHELKTPLTSLKLQSQLRKRNIQSGDLSKFTLERLTNMFAADERQFVRITHLIDDMLDISRISLGKLTVTLEQFDLCALVRELLELSTESFVAAGCTVTFDDCQPAVGNWDRFRIEQVVMNLLTNAMRYGAGKSITLQVAVSGDRARIVVRDHGRGIAKENQERIFQRFERAVTGNEISGLGLGLYIVRQILETHRGTIHVESELGHGSKFVVELPLLQCNEEAEHGS